MATDAVYIEFTEQGSTPSTPATGKWRLYTKSDGLYVVDDAGATVGPFIDTGGGGGVPDAHACRVTRASTNFSVGNNTLTAVQFDAEDYDTDTMHDNSTQPTRVTIPSISGVTTGLWALDASGYGTINTGRTDVEFRKNAAGNPASGTSLGFCPSVDGDGSAVGGFSGHIKVVLSAGDYVECFVRTTAGSGAVAYDSAGSPLFEVTFLGKVT